MISFEFSKQGKEALQQLKNEGIKTDNLRVIIEYCELIKRQDGDNDLVLYVRPDVILTNWNKQ